MVTVHKDETNNKPDDTILCDIWLNNIKIVYYHVIFPSYYADDFCICLKHYLEHGMEKRLEIYVPNLKWRSTNAFRPKSR